MTLLTFPLRLALSLIVIALFFPLIAVFSIFKPKLALEDLKYLIIDLWTFTVHGIK